MNWVLIVGAGIIVIIVLLLFLGMIYEFVQSSRDKKLYKDPPGEIVHAGGHNLHILTMGDPQDNQPTVVLDAGIGANSLDWQKVQPKVAEFAQVVSYDRAGYGWSEVSDAKRTPERIAEELHELLKTAMLPPPYLMVGHSFGGIYCRVFAEMYPDDVAGLVLVDSSHPEMIREKNTEPEIKRLKRVQRFQRIGILRPMLPSIIGRANVLDDASLKQYLAMNLLDNSNTLREAIPIFRDGVELSESVNVPLTVISRERDEDIESEAIWTKYQDKLAELSSDTVHIHTESGSHWIALSDPDTVVTAIHDMLERLNNESSLPQHKEDN